MPGSVIQGLFPNGLTRIARPGGPARATPNGSAVPLPQQLAVPAHGGQPLAPEVLQRMEAAFGTSFRDVRVHVGAQPAALGALAFAHGSHVYFAPGQYDPSSARGLRVLGHELAHVVQQRTGRVANPFGTGVAVVQNRVLELEADRMAERAAAAMQHGAPVQRKIAGPPVPPNRAPRPAAVQRNAAVHVTSPTKVGDASYRIAARAGGQEAGSVLVHARGRAEIVVTDLGVSPEHRKQGVGNALIESACRAGLQLGKSKVVLSSQDNGSGKLTQWYKRMGFTPAGHDQKGLVKLEAPISRVMAGVGQAKMAPGRVLQRAEAKGKTVNIPQGRYAEVTKGDTAFTENITTCTAVYVRSGTGRVVVYHWPFSRVKSEEYREQMAAAVDSIGATGNVAKIILHTKSDVADLQKYLTMYTKDITVDRWEDYYEPLFLFDGSRAF
ncbi:MAG TPA: GNAT family N-acetyltransferase [Thermoanaerobaculia bacterium]|nr:GNAT family N-acetyltransferase [Thermoanaerobaculia bacterium]